jgi:hypothetical protein
LCKPILGRDNFFAALRLGEKKNPPRRTSKDAKTQRVRRGEQALDEEKNLIPSPQKSDTA